MKHIELKDTIAMMESSDYKDRFLAEYYQVKIRYDKLKNMIDNIDNWDNLSFIPICSKDVYISQLQAMALYINILEKRAKIENITLEE